MTRNAWDAKLALLEEGEKVREELDVDKSDAENMAKDGNSSDDLSGSDFR
jgi:hypothetical protein